MPKCVLKSCKNNTLTSLKKDGVTYHRFPVNEIMREKWRKLVSRERCEEFYKPNESSVICSNHFLESDKYCTQKGYKRLKKSAVPQIKVADIPISLQPRKTGLEDPCTSQESISFEELEQSHQSETTMEIKQEEENCFYFYESTTDVKQEVEICFDFQESTMKAKPQNGNSPFLETEQNQVENSPSSSLSGISSVLDTPEIIFYKKELSKCYGKLQFKNREVRNLRKQNNRLRKANISLKGIVQDLKRKRLIDDSTSNDVEKYTKNNDESILKILSANIKKKFSTYPQAFRKFVHTLYSYSPAAYLYLRRTFNNTLPHPSTLLQYSNIKMKCTAKVYEKGSHTVSQ